MSHSRTLPQVHPFLFPEASCESLFKSKDYLPIAEAEVRWGGYRIRSQMTTGDVWRF